MDRLFPNQFSGLILLISSISTYLTKGEGWNSSIHFLDTGQSCSNHFFPAISSLNKGTLIHVHLLRCHVSEHGLVGLVGRSHHPAGVPGGQEGPGFFRSQSAAADESE